MNAPGASAGIRAVFPRDGREPIRMRGFGEVEVRVRELGVDEESIEAAVAAQDPGEELGAALELLRRRCPTPPANRMERDRALGILMRRGYAPELALDLLVREPDPVGFFGALTKTMVEEGESVACGVWLIDEGGQRCD